MKNVCEIRHPLVRHHLVSLRDRKTAPGAFRRMIERLSMLLTYEATKDLQTTPVAAAETLTRWGVRRIKLLCMIAAPEGIRRVRARFPGLQIYVCAIDKKLNRKGCILPGLDDAGDRIFNAQAT